MARSAISLTASLVKSLAQAVSTGLSGSCCSMAQAAREAIIRPRSLLVNIVASLAPTPSKRPIGFPNAFLAFA